MVYYIEDTFAKIFDACGLKSMLKNIDKQDNSQIELDFEGRTYLFPTPNALDKLNNKFLPKVGPEDENPIRNRYIQGDADGGNLKFLFGQLIPNYEENDPEDDLIEVSKNTIEERAAYIDSHGNPSALAIFYRKDRPEEWIIIVVKNTHLPPNERTVHIMSSVNPELFIKNTDVIKINVESITTAREKLQTASGLPAVNAMLANILNEKEEAETIKQGADLFHKLFSSSFSHSKVEEFDDDAGWMKLMEEQANQLINNPILIALSSMKIKLSREQIVKCLNNEENDLPKNLKSILLEEKDSSKQEIRMQLALNLDNLGHLKQFSQFAEDKDSFIKFFNQLVKDSNNHNLLKSLLKDEKLDSLRLLHRCENSAQLMTLLQKSDKPNLIIDKLMDFATSIKKETHQPKNAIVLPQAIQFLIEHPETEVHDKKFKKLIDFLNEPQGIEQINPELLSKFLSENLDDDELLKSVNKTLAQLFTLEVTSSEAYELALNNKEFRAIVSSLNAKNAEKEDRKKCVELAINLAKLNMLAAYEKLSGNKPLLNALINKNVAIEAAQVTKILDAENDLAMRLQTISETKTNEPRKQALYQLAIDLHKLGALESFNQFEKEETQFLDVFHKMTVVPDGCDIHWMSELPKEKKQYRNSYLFIPNEKEDTLYYINALGEAESAPLIDISQFKLDLANKGKLHLNNTDIKKITTHTLPDRAQLLKAMLTEYPLGLQILKLIAHSDEGVNLFRKYLAVTNKTDVNKNLDRLNRENLTPRITSLAIQLLLEKPDISDAAFESSVAFLKTIQRSRKYGSDITNFLVATCDNKILLSETQATFKKLDEVGADTGYLYKTALETTVTETAKKIREIVLDLPPISVDKARGCGFFKMKKKPSEQDLARFDSPQFILIKNKLLYYNHPPSREPQTIELNPVQLKQLKSEFPTWIKKLSAEQFKKLTKIAPIHKHNIERCTLAEKLQKLRQLKRYDDYAKDNQLIFSFNKFTKYALMDKILEERHLERETILKNPRLNALIDAGICPTKYQQINQLLDETSDKSKAMDELLSLKLVDETAYKWAFIDTPSGEAFRKVLHAIVDNKAIKPADKPKMIQTLCALQLENKATFGLFLGPGTDEDKSKAINELLSLKLTNPKDYQLAFSNNDSGKAFRKVLTAIVADEKNIKPKDKPQMIQTLSSLLQKEQAPVKLFLGLQPNSDKFKAINALLTLKLENPTDYEWALSDNLLGHKFRKVLLAVVNDNENIKPENKPQMIQSLCSLQSKNNSIFDLFFKLTPKSDKTKAINALLLSLKLDDQKDYEWTFRDTPHGNAFRKALLAIVADQTIKEDKVKTQMIQTLCARLENKDNFKSFLELKPDDNKFKVINALLSLKLETPEAYQWVFRDDDPGKAFTKVVFAIAADQTIEEDVKTRMIQTLSSLLQKKETLVELFLKLKPESDELKAINALLSLKLENPTAYEWAVSDAPPGESFRKVLVAIDKYIKPENKPQTIQTLCALQGQDDEAFASFLKLTPESDESKAINALLSLNLVDPTAYQWALSDVPPGNAFRTVLLAIIADQTINKDVKPQIQTLCSPKMKNLLPAIVGDKTIKEEVIKTLCALLKKKEDIFNLFLELKPESDELKAINALLSLKLENPTAYEWAVSDVPPGESFRKVLLAIVDDNSIEPENKPQMIQTLCLLQVVNNKTFGSFYKLKPEEEEFKAINALLSLKLENPKAYEFAFSNDDSGKAFRKILLAIHDAGEKNIKAKDKPRMIQTLCSLLSKNENTLNSILELMSEDDEFKAINALLSLELTDPTAYQWALRKDNPGQAFRKILLAIHDADEKNIKVKDKPRMIQTLCSLLNNQENTLNSILKLTSEDDEFKAINALLSLKFDDPKDYERAFRSDDPGKAFRKVVFAIAADQTIKEDVKTRMIQTLSSLLQQEEAPVESFLKLKPESDEFKAINALLSLKLENPKAYEFAFSNDDSGKAFRKILLAIHADQTIEEDVKTRMIQTLGSLKMGTIVENQTIDEAVKPQMIKTLCALQMEKEQTIGLFSVLKPEDENFKAINALLTLKLGNPTDYEWAFEWAFRDDLLGNEFRKVLLDIVVDEAIKDEIKPRIIQTLYLLQMEKKNSFNLYSKKDESDKSDKSDESDKKFRQAILKIENNCQQIQTRLKKEAPEKAKEFGKAEQEYRKGLYDAVYDTLENKPTQEKFEANIEKSSKPMLTAVDPDRHPWLRRAMMVLTNILNVICGTAPARLSVGRTFFYQHTTSGTEVRNLHQDLTKDFQNEFKAHKKGLQDLKEKESDKEESLDKDLSSFNK